MEGGTCEAHENWRRDAWHSADVRRQPVLKSFIHPTLCLSSSFHSTWSTKACELLENNCLFEKAYFMWQIYSRGSSSSRWPGRPCRVHSFAKRSTVSQCRIFYNSLVTWLQCYVHFFHLQIRVRLALVPRPLSPTAFPPCFFLSIKCHSDDLFP